MDNTLEIFNVTNYAAHPTNPHYVVFKYKTETEQLFFEGLLKADSIEFESSHIETENDSVFMVAIKTGDQNKAVSHNYLTKGKFRDRTITSKKWKWLIYLVTGIVFSFAIVGFLKS